MGLIERLVRKWMKEISSDMEVKTRKSLPQVLYDKKAHFCGFCQSGVLNYYEEDGTNLFFCKFCNRVVNQS